MMYIQLAVSSFFFVFAIPCSGEKYLMAFPDPSLGTIMAVTGETEGKCKVTYPDLAENTIMISPYTVNYYNIRPKVFGAAVQKSLLVSVDDPNSMNIYGTGNNATYTPLPLRALGRKYIVSDCHRSKSNALSVLVLAAHGHAVSINVRFVGQQNFTLNGIAYNTGTFSKQIMAYETLRLQSNNSFTGSRIDADDVIAVYSGTSKDGNILMYAQLLPVNHLGHNFTMYFDESRMNFSAQITTVHNKTDFNGSSLSIGGLTGSISHKTGNGTSLYRFSKPTVVVLCGESGLAGMSVVPDVKLFQNKAFLPQNGETIVIITNRNPNTIKVGNVNKALTWSSDKGVNIGTLRTPVVPGASVSITSTESFYVIAISERSLYTAGFSFPYIEADDDDGDHFIIGVAAGTGLSVTTGMFAAGFFIVRRQRRRNRGNGGSGGEQGEKPRPGEENPPQPPQPPNVPV